MLKITYVSKLLRVTKNKQKQERNNSQNWRESSRRVKIILCMR